MDAEDSNDVANDLCEALDEGSDGLDPIAGDDDDGAGEEPETGDDGDGLPAGPGRSVGTYVRLRRYLRSLWSLRPYVRSHWQLEPTEAT